MNIQSTVIKDELHNRLRRIEGQVRGVQRMVDEDRECREIVQQLNAIRAAVQTATTVFMRAYARDCLLSAAHVTPAEQQTLVDELLSLMSKT